MADVYRTGKLLKIDGVLVPPGTEVPNAATKFINLLAMLSSNELILTQTSVTETNQTRQFVPTANEIPWHVVLPGPSKVITTLVDDSGEVDVEESIGISTLTGAGAVTAAGTVS